ncbi:hypothetical protein [Chryseolinea soli]|uniref:Uncharacterized protein n=1 Tax=Chryseolinea soli TaxID=2321403 RepID=A0A385SSY5_9BACT|nr:hypothetical protein [Chryseolinea soli]AYB34004.1 hypothetical protein D4L85_27010 [Chryseolinea soli]
MKAFLFALIIFVAVDASVLNADFKQRTEEDEVEFSDVAVEMPHGIAVQMVKRPWARVMHISTGRAGQPKLNCRYTAFWSYSTTPAEVAVNSDA